MSKDTFYFTHDYNARRDPKIKKLRLKYKWEGYGLYWAIIEDLYNNGNSLPLDYDVMSDDYSISIELIKSIIHDFELFVFSDGNFGSISVERRINDRNAKSIKARESANYRWSKKAELDANALINDANALRQECDSNAIKERKGNEIKGKDREAAKAATQKRILNFKESLYPYCISKGGKYTDEMVKDFFNYWSELNKSETKMKWELLQTFQIPNRLATWVKREKPIFGSEQPKTNIFKTTD